MSPPLRLCRPVSSPSAEENVDNINTAVFIRISAWSLKTYYAIQRTCLYVRVRACVHACECVGGCKFI